MGACLLQMHSQADSVAEARMHQLTFEAIRLVGRRLRLNPSGHRALLSSNASLAHAPTDKLQPQYYTHLLVCMLPCLLATIAVKTQQVQWAQSNVLLSSWMFCCALGFPK